MTNSASYTLDQWAEARRLRAQGLSFRAIAQQLGFRSGETINNRASKEGWAIPRADAPVRAGQGRPLSHTAQRMRRSLAQHLFSIVALQIRRQELCMTKQLDDHEQSPDGKAPPMLTREEHESFSWLVEHINLVTEMASEPALAADGRRKSASINPELTALSGDIDAGGLSAASEKDNLRREIAEKLEKILPPSPGS